MRTSYVRVRPSAPTAAGDEAMSVGADDGDDMMHRFYGRLRRTQRMPVDYDNSAATRSNAPTVQRSFAPSCGVAHVDSFAATTRAGRLM